MSEYTLEQILRRQRLGMTLLAAAMSVAVPAGMVLAAGATGTLDRGQVFWPLGGLLIVLVTVGAPAVWLAGSAGEKLRRHPSGAEYATWSMPVFYRAYAMFMIHMGVAGFVLAGIALGLLVAGVASTFPRGLVVFCSVIYIGLFASGLQMLRLERHVT